MLCIKCHQPGTEVTNSRPHKKQPSVWRRRHCVNCGETFTTNEIVSTDGLKVDQATQESIPYSQPRLLISLYDSLKHRPEAADDAFWLSVSIGQQLALKSSQRRVTSDILCETAYTTLKRFDAAAGLHYGLRHRLVKT